MRQGEYLRGVHAPLLKLGRYSINKDPYPHTVSLVSHIAESLIFIDLGTSAGQAFYAPPWHELILS